MAEEISWDRQTLAFDNKGAAYYFINKALDEIPTFSMFTRDARRAMAQMIADELPVKENSDEA